MGERDLACYAGRWLVFFSHPADFTPVCTSEFVAFAKAFDRFQALDCDLLGLSVDSLFSHLAWIQSIAHRFKVKIPFPLVEDPSMAIARAYGMLPPGADSSATVRTTFVIDPAGIVRASITYPMSVGRNVDEILRLVAALQATDSAEVSTPEGWRPGDPVILAPLLSVDAIEQRAGEDGADWYYRLGSL
ncbi:peroxiredoxin [Hyphomicrobiales bacterium BP6-180914]|uniref:Thioredoxin peroxidase n=2 Tax=Lichenifustis flavocetrariae TaxID=2949735 RepID=A0AA41Z1J4_9HYPH|nr:peroxiredoxin [Lichenifustis flavocetrariae]